MSTDTDGYESEDSQAATGSKYYQIYVPSYGTTPVLPPQTSNGSTVTQTMSSFLRLGMPVSGAASTYGDPDSTYGDALLAKAWSSSPSYIGNAVYDAASTAAQGITSISDSCVALATAVVDAVTTAVATYPGNTSAYTCSTTSVATYANDAYVAAGGSGSTALAAAQGAAVEAALGPFVDDSRDQGSANNANSLTVAERIAESARLFTKGGWRDHTDGNRVSTTYGDKVEVIRGNFKLIVLGRQDQATNGHIWESSGGMLQDNDLAPGQITEIKWVETQGGTWRAVETCTKGDVDTTFDGKVVERFVGGSVSTIVGRETKATTTGTIPTDTVTQLTAEWNQAKADKYVDSTLSFDAYMTQRGYNKNGGSTSEDWYYQEDGGDNPVVFEQTWASRIESYTGSSAAWVPEIIETTYATTINETTNATTIDQTTNATGISETTSTSTSISIVKASSSVAESVDVTGGNNAVGTGDLANGHITTKIWATSMWDEMHVERVQELNFGSKWELVLGAWLTLKLGLSLEIFVGPNVTVSGAKYDFTGVLVDQAFFKYENEGVKLDTIDVFKGKAAPLNYVLAGLAVLV